MARLSTYQMKLRALLSPVERRVLERLNTPVRIQAYLDSFPVNVLGKRSHTMRSPREVLKVKKAHCLEGAMLASLALAYHGREPLLMDLVARDEDLDHAVALFKEDGLWGAISKTNYPVLRWRDPVFKTPRELAMSYFHEYFFDDGRKSLLRYSAPFSLKKFNPAQWVTAAGDVDWVAEALGRAPHFPTVSKKKADSFRRASNYERHASWIQEWTKDGKRSK